MAKFNVTKIVPEGFLHSSGFNEIIDSVSWSLASLGHDVSVTQNWFSEQQETNIIFGAELIADYQRLPPNSIIYNLEQPSHPNMDKVRKLASESGAVVWDYSQRNVEEWKKIYEHVHHVPIGYTPNISRIPRASSAEFTYDLAFFGWMTERRTTMLNKLRKSGLNVYDSAACYGGGRDNILSRSRVALNLHHDGRDRFEIARCSYYMANFIPVVTEVSSDDDEYQDLKGLTKAPYRILADVCASLVKAPGEAMRMCTEAYESFARRDYAASISAALDCSIPVAPAISRATEWKAQRQAEKRDYLRQGRDLKPLTDVQRRFDLASSQGDMKDFAQWLHDHAKGNIVEIGVRDGASTSCFLSGLEEHGGHLWSIDIQPCGDLFKGHPQWSFLQADSKDLQTCIRFIPYEIDILLIDGDHSRAGVISDIEYARQLRPGGMVLFHDIAPEDRPSGCADMSWPGDDVKSVYEALCDTMSPLGWTHEELPGRYGMGVLHKPGPVPATLPSPPADSDESWEGSKAALEAAK